MYKPFALLLLSLFFSSLLLAQNPVYTDPSYDLAIQKHKDALIKGFQNNLDMDQSNSVFRQYDALYYYLDFKIEYNPNLLIGTVKGSFASKAEDVSKIQLDMDDGLQIQQIKGNISGYHHDNQLLEITLDKPYDTGEIFEVTISYSGLPAAGTGFRYFRFDTMDDGSPHVWTLSEPYGARYWWPCKDSPRDKADSVDIVVTVPSGQLVASNGTLLSTVDNQDGTSTFHWQERYPIATYLVSLAIGNYAHFQDYYISETSDTLLLDYYVYPSNLETAQSAFTEMHDYLDAFTYYFGPYPFQGEKYGMAEFGWGGGMEHQTITSIGRVSSSARYLYVHELGHQWFGDLITCDSWQEIWLNEGFASYSEALYAEWAGFAGNPPGMESYHAFMSTQVFKDGGTIFREDTTSFGSLFNWIVYDKGSWVLHMLRHVVGDDAFFKILKDYLHDPRWRFGAAKTENFIEVCEHVTGMNLGIFFNQWLYYPYFPEYTYNWDTVDRQDGVFTVEVNIIQKQSTVIYEMPIDLTFEFQSLDDTTISVLNNQAEQSYKFSFNADPEDVLFDKDNWILKQAEPFSDAKFTTDVIIEEYYPNPFNEEVTLKVRNWFFKGITLQVFDVTGKKITELEPVKSSSDHEFDFRWDGTNEFGVKVSTGVYIVSPAGPNASGIHAKKLIKLR